VSKVLNEDLGGMTKISKRDLNMNMERGCFITDGIMQILTLTSALFQMETPWRCQEHYIPCSQPFCEHGQKLTAKLNIKSTQTTNHKLDFEGCLSNKLIAHLSTIIYCKITESSDTKVPNQPIN